MGKVFAIIGVLLAGVIAVAFSITIYEDELRHEKKASAAMFAFAPAEVDRVVIDCLDCGQALLVREDGHWVLPALGKFPADDARIAGMLRRLLAMETTLPAGSGPAALREFRLAEDDFERRITLEHAGETLATVFLGSPQGPRHLHARRAEDDSAYAVAFGLFDAAANDEEWIDRAVLKLTDSDIAAIEIGDLRLVPAAPGAGGAEAPDWLLDGDAVGGALDSNAANRLTELLADIEIESILPAASEAETGLEAPLLSLSVTRRNGEVIDYRLGKASLTEDYALSVSTRPQVFRLSAYTARRLVEAARKDTLLKSPEPRHHAAAGAGSGTPARLHN